MQPGRNKAVMDTNIVISAAISTDGTPAKIFELFLDNLQPKFYINRRL